MKASDLLKQLEEELSHEGITVKVKTGEDINKQAEELFARVERKITQEQDDNNEEE